jgi:YggT family protein
MCQLAKRAAAAALPVPRAKARQAGLSARGGPAKPSPVVPAESAMRAILDVVLLALDIYVWVIIASAVLSWLIAFNVINMRNDFVRMIYNGVYQLTEPVLAPIRRRLPNMGGLDISPIVLLLLIFLIQRVIGYYIYPNEF